MENQFLEAIRHSVRDQFGASLDMLENAINACTESVWKNDLSFSRLSYHTLFFLDYYLTLQPVGFAPPLPFVHSEFEDEPAAEVFRQPEILDYLHTCRAKMGLVLSELTEELAQSRWINESHTMNYSVLEILLYNLRHVQHHVGQLNVILRKNGIEAPDWVYREGSGGKP
jgi:hypothetical protein